MHCDARFATSSALSGITKICIIYIRRAPKYEGCEIKYRRNFRYEVDISAGSRNELMYEPFAVMESCACLASETSVCCFQPRILSQV
jgi:hypothetical protein